MTYLVTFLCLLAVVLEGLIARIKRAVIALTPVVVVQHTTGVYPVYTNGMFDAITTIVPLPSYKTRLTHAVHGYPRTSVRGGALRHGYTHHADTPQYTKYSPTTVHCITNVIAIEVECLPSVDEQVDTLHAKHTTGCHEAAHEQAYSDDWEADTYTLPTLKAVPAPFYHGSVDEYEHMYMCECGRWSEPGSGGRMGHKGYKARGYMHPVDMTITPTGDAYPHDHNMADAILKREQEEAMWKDRPDAITTDQLGDRAVYSPSPIEFLCECGGRACSCEEERAINEQAEYDLANGLCLNCHQSPCCFDCEYDDDDDDDTDDDDATDDDHKVCGRCKEAIYWDGCLCQYATEDDATDDDDVALNLVGEVPTGDKPAPFLTITDSFNIYGEYNGKTFTCRVCGSIHHRSTRNDQYNPTSCHHLFRITEWDDSTNEVHVNNVDVEGKRISVEYKDGVRHALTFAEFFSLKPSHSDGSRSLGLGLETARGRWVIYDHKRVPNPVQSILAKVEANMGPQDLRDRFDFDCDLDVDNLVF